MKLDLRRFPVLVVDDEPDILQTFEFNYADEFSIVTADSGHEALALLQEIDPAVVIVDQRMPGMDGVEFLERSIAVRPDAVRIILTGYADQEALVQAVNSGQIYRYIRKPWNTGELRDAIARGMEVFHLTRENARLIEELAGANAQLATVNEQLAAENRYLRRSEAPSEIVGESEVMRSLLEHIRKVAPLQTTVLIEGETGSGKELVARAIHNGGPRRDRLFLPVNCSAFPDNLLESELFGHRKGSFSGADRDRKGLFDVASGGTIFLDEIGDTSAALQARLLRVLENSEIRPVGDSQPRRVDTRVIAATNRNLAEEVRRGTFREDLLFRLRVFPVHVPPLRERPGDIAILAKHFLSEVSAQLNKRVGALTNEALELLERYAFPGNVRELRNELERAIILAEPGAPITEDLLSERIQDVPTIDAPPSALQGRTRAFEREQIVAALERAGGVKTQAARELGVTYRGLLKKMQRLKMLPDAGPDGSSIE